MDQGTSLPVFSICSGRPLPYVEAMTQALTVQAPVLFESGGGMFDPASARVMWHPALTSEMEDALEDIRHWLIHECVPGTSFTYDYGKRTQAGVIGPRADEVDALAPVVEAYVAERYDGFCVFHTPVSIDVVPAAITKRQGLAWLADHLGCAMTNVAFIGDTNGDLGALEAVGYPFAPANATDEVKRCVERVTPGAVIDGVLEAYRWCTDRTQQILTDVME